MAKWVYNRSVQIEDIWDGKTLGTQFIRAILVPLSLLQEPIWAVKRGVYTIGLKKAAEPHRPVICIGNLVAGGSGKSPLTMYLARILIASGREVVIGCSGYGFEMASAAQFAPDGPLDPMVWGDEPSMIRSLLPDVAIVVGRRRVLAAELVHQRYPNAVLLMDDGFTHTPLKKHLTIVLDDPFPTNPYCQPAGPYREPRRNRLLADLVLPGHFHVVAEPMRLVDRNGKEHSPAKYSVLCALGQPAKFLEALKKAFPCELPGGPERLMKDHDPLDGGNLLDGFPVELPIVVTSKDWVKLKQRSDVGTRQFLVATHQVRVEPEEEFKEWLKAKLDEYSAEIADQ